VKETFVLWQNPSKSMERQEVLERTNLPTFLISFKNVICIKTSVCPNITLVGNAVLILKHSHVPNNVKGEHLGDVGVDERTLLKWIFKVQGVRVWNGFNGWEFFVEVKDYHFL
jgi:hypothetical protein